MAADLDDLRARSDALADRLEDDGALEVNAEILAALPGDAKATLRLGAGLMAVGRVKDALDVYEKGAQSNPRNTMIANRVKQARNAVALGETAPPAGGKRRKPATPTAWLKSIHHDPVEDADWTIAPGEETWISDAGQHDADGNRMYRADGTPWGEPSWQIGAKVGLYFGGTYRVPILVEITGKPYCDEEFVARESGKPEDGRRWPWVTPVRGISAVSLADAPRLEDLGIPHSSMQQRARLVLDDEQRKRLLALLGG
jgi:hypothetical protein